MPDWTKFLLALLVPMAGAAIGYGQLRADQASLVARVDRAELQWGDERDRRERLERDAREALDSVRVVLGRVQLDLARVCGKLNAGCREQ